VVATNSADVCPKVIRAEYSSLGMPRRIGVIGFGKIGKFLVEKMLSPDCPVELQLVFVFDAMPNTFDGTTVPESLRLADLSDFERYSPDLIVEASAHVAPPRIACVCPCTSPRSHTRT
jgi:predicted dinucleotide-utilizing enzyme